MRRIVTVAALTLAVAGCGVKSAPKHPEGAVYPGFYPAAEAPPPAAKAEPEETKRRGTRPSAYGSGDGYQPPKPATETLAQ